VIDDGSGLLEGQRGAEERPVPVTSGGEEEEDPISNIQYPEGFEKTCVAAGTYLDQAGQWAMDNGQIYNIQSYANANANADAEAK